MFDEDKAFEVFNHINVVTGLVIGWQVIRSCAGCGMMSGFNNGLTGDIVLLFWELLLHSAVRMIELRDARGLYDGAFDAIAGLFQVMNKNALLIATLVIIGTAGSLRQCNLTEVSLA